MSEKIDKILEATDVFQKLAAKKKDVGNFIFPADHSKVSDKKPHFPINNANHARNALSQANKFKEAPEWYKGSLKEFLSTVVKKVKKEFPGIEVTKKSEKPGKD